MTDFDDGGDWMPGVDYPESVRDREHRIEKAARNLLDVARQHDVPLGLTEALVALKEALDG